MTWAAQTNVRLERSEMELVVVERGVGENLAYCDYLSSMTVQRIPYGERIPQGVFVPRGMLQAIMDGLWHDGFRPTGITDVRESTAALKDHLKDMRAIAAKKIGVVLP